MSVPAKTNDQHSERQDPEAQATNLPTGHPELLMARLTLPVHWQTQMRHRRALTRGLYSTRGREHHVEALA